jgi:hypothetical protein
VAQNCTGKFSIGPFDFHREVLALFSDEFHKLLGPAVIGFNVQQHCCLLLLLLLLLGGGHWYCKVLKGVPTVPTDLGYVEPNKTRGCNAKTALWEKMGSSSSSSSSSNSSRREKAM